MVDAEASYLITIANHKNPPATLTEFSQMSDLHLKKWLDTEDNHDLPQNIIFYTTSKTQTPPLPIPSSFRTYHISPANFLSQPSNKTRCS